ncbi:cupin domain-containing protein [uncultured Enterovirga sp.]|uniref:cupin domain-containing protein n=1 Tax=uncultured Enterovirga sp. TaxID=2026352 RepID=UPI0035CBCA20
MRLGSLTAPTPRNENHRIVQVVFTPSDLEASRILGVERSTYFTSGRSPIHAESHSEEIIYFRRGRGKVLLGKNYIEVGPGSAVAIPSGIEHHVVNSGEDVLEHVLISAEIGDCPVQATYMASADDVLPEDQTRLLSRLTCTRLDVAEDQKTAEAILPDHEAVYTLSGGSVIAHVKLAGTDYEWQYALDPSSCFWIPAGVPHSFRNIGDIPVRLVKFGCRA